MITAAKPREQAINSARFLGSVIGEAHARQMDGKTRKAWFEILSHNRSKSLGAPSTFLWRPMALQESSHRVSVAFVLNR
jgi:hypothetical protein